MELGRLGLGLGLDRLGLGLGGSRAQGGVRKVGVWVRGRPP